MGANKESLKAIIKQEEENTKGFIDQNIPFLFERFKELFLKAELTTNERARIGLIRDYILDKNEIQKATFYGSLKEEAELRETQQKYSESTELRRYARIFKQIQE